MPYKVRRVERQGKMCYEVVNKETGRIHARCTSRRNADRQRRLLEGVEHGMTPRGRTR